MKRKTSIAVLLFFLSVITFGQSERTTCTITGTLSGDYSDFIYLRYNEIKDSVKVVNNKFTFTVHNLVNPTQASLHLKGISYIDFLWIESGNINVTADYSSSVNAKGETINSIQITKATGSHSEDIADEYAGFYQANMAKDNFHDLLLAKLQTFITDNKKQPFSGRVLAELSEETILTPPELQTLYSLLDTTRQEKEYLKLYKDRLAKLEQYGVGKPFLPFRLESSDGKLIDNTALQGKITLLDFWASWCGPCRGAFPSLINLKEELKNQNFDIVGISQDEDTTRWHNAIKKDNLLWTNLLDKDKKVSNELGITGIPYNVLLDEHMNIIGKNLTPEQIKMKVKARAN